VSSLTSNQILRRIAKSSLAEQLGRQPTKQEINECMKAERPPAKFGQISASEVQRVEELLRR
jgi:DNA-directed RNA polymerase specialized sigma subunit